LNGRHGHDILSIAQHLGERPEAESARISQLSQTSVTFEWQWTDPATGIVHREEKQLDTKSGCLDWLLEKQSQPANKRHPSLIPPPPSSLSSSSQRQLVTFTLPPIFITAAVLVGLTMLTFLSFTQSESVFVQWIFWVVPQWCFRLTARILMVVHGLEAVVMFMACRGLKRREYFDIPLTTAL
ncbi:hypothetical protein GGI05_006690, partial [Coemansia sp. RSA 2603]